MNLQLFLNTPLKRKKRVIALNFSENSLADWPEQWTDFCNGLSQCSHLTKLNLSSNALGYLRPEQWTIFFNALSQCSHLTTLDLSANALGYFWHQPWTVFFNELSRCAHLTTLNLSSNSLGTLSSKQWTDFFNGLSQHLHLTTLNLSGNSLGYLRREEWIAFSNGLPQCPHVTTLNLSRNSFKNLLAANLQETSPFIFINTLVLTNSAIEFMSKKQLEAFAKLFPRALKISIQHDKDELTSTNKLHYLRARAGEKTIFEACLLHHIGKKNYPKESAVMTCEAANTYPGVFLNEDIIKKIADFLPDGEAIIKGLTGLFDNDKALTRELHVFLAQRTPRRFLSSFFFKKPLPSYYKDSMTDLQASLTAKIQTGEDVSAVCSVITAAFNVKKTLNPLEQEFHTFIQDITNARSITPFSIIH